MGLIVMVVIICLLFRKKKPTEVLFVDFFEIVRVPERRKLPPVLVNTLLIAGMLFLFWIVS
jgi:hypothetical protein